MSEEDFDKKLMYLEGRINDCLVDNLNQVYMSIERLKSEINNEQAELKEKLVKAEAKLKIYEAMFEKLNLNVNLNHRGEGEE